MTLPEGWVTARLGDVVVGRVSQGVPGTQAVPYIDIGAIDRDRKTISETQDVTSSTAPTRARQWVQGGDVLVSMTRPNLNAVAQVPEALDGAVASTGFDVLRAIGVLPEWIYYRVRSEAFVQDICSGVQGVVYPAIRPADVRRHELPLPPRPEQERIVEELESYLSRLDSAVASLEATQRKLKAYRASVLKAAVGGRLVPTEAELARKEGRSYEPADVLLARILEERRRRWEEAELAKMKAAGKTPKDDRWKAKYLEPEPPDVTKLPALPEGWCWVTLSGLCTAIGDVDHKMPRAVEDGDYAYVSTKDFSESGIDFLGAKKIAADDFERLSRKIRPSRGDLLLSRYGTVGEVRLVQVDRRFQASYSIAIIKPTPRVNAAFLAIALRSDLLQQQMRGAIRASAQPDLGLEHIRTLAVPFPPSDEQSRIVEEVERLESLGATVDATLNTERVRTVRLRQAILAWAFEGKLVDQDPGDEPADVLLARIRAVRASAAPTARTAKRARTVKVAS